MNEAGETFDLAIVGAGPVGATLALGLAESPLSVLLVGDAAFPDTVGRLGFDLRAMTLNLGSEAFLSELGVWPLLAGDAAPFSSVEAWDHEGSGSIRFTAAEAGTDRLGHLVQMRHLEPLLWRQCRKNPRLTCVSGKVASITREPGQSLLQLEDGTCYRARLLAGADGVDSRVREACKLPCREWSYRQSSIVSLVRLEREHEQCAIQSFTADGPLALLPLSDPRHCVLIFSVETPRVQALLDMPDDDFCATLSRLSDYRFGRVSEVDRRIAIPLRQRHARKYVGEGVLLLGDAAHRLHPLAGQGLNLGLRDARRAAQLLGRAARAGLEVRDARLLERYDRHRQADNLAFTAAVEGFRRGFHAASPAWLTLRNWMMSRVNRTPAFKQWFLDAALGRHFLAD